MKKQVIATITDNLKILEIAEEIIYILPMFSQLEHEGVTIDNPNVKLISDTINNLLNLLY